MCGLAIAPFLFDNFFIIGLFHPCSALKLHNIYICIMKYLNLNYLLYVHMFKYCNIMFRFDIVMFILHNNYVQFM